MLPDFTIAYFQKLRTGSWRSSITNNRYFNDIIPDIKDADLRACIGKKNAMVGSRNSTAPLKNDELK